MRLSRASVEKTRKLAGDNAEKEHVTMVEALLGREFVVILLRVVE